MEKEREILSLLRDLKNLEVLLPYATAYYYKRIEETEK